MTNTATTYRDAKPASAAPAPDDMRLWENRPPIEAGYCQVLGVIFTLISGLALAAAGLAALTAGIGAAIALAGPGLALAAVGAALFALGAALREQVRQRWAIMRVVEAATWMMQRAAATEGGADSGAAAIANP